MSPSSTLHQGLGHKNKGDPAAAFHRQRERGTETLLPVFIYSLNSLIERPHV